MTPSYKILNRWKEYYVKVDVRSADINNSRFTHGLYVQYGCGFLAEKKELFKKFQKNWLSDIFWHEKSIIRCQNFGIFFFWKIKKDAYKTKCLDGSLSPKWNDSRLISIPKMTEEILEAFESDSITFTVYGKQVEGKGAAPKVSHDSWLMKMSWYHSRCLRDVLKMFLRHEHVA